MRILLSALLLGASLQAETRPNVLFLCIDDLRPELKCYGVDHIRSPHIDKIAGEGRFFTRHYVQAPTCGASRYALMTGTYGPSDNDALFRAAKDRQNLTTLPGHFRQEGYTTVSVGKVSHHPGGRGGNNWNDEAIPEMPGAWDRHLMPTGDWLHPRGAMHGLANGEIREDVPMKLFQSAIGDDDIYPDGLITHMSLDQLDDLAVSYKQKHEPFFLAIGWLKPHLPFGAPAKYMEPYANLDLPPIPHPNKPPGITTWHNSNEFRRYETWNKNPNQDAMFADDVRKHYAACVTYVDAQLGIVMQKLEQLGIRDNTIIVVWGDHGWHLGEHAIWGKHSLFEESLRAPLIIRYSGIPQPGVGSPAIVESIDIFPTLCELAGIPTPAGLDGSSLRPILADPTQTQDVAVSVFTGAECIRTDRYRLIRHKADAANKSAFELYDHRSADGETVNLADRQPDTVKELERLLDEKLKR